MLPITLGALDERRLMGMDASDLSALAGARQGTVGATLQNTKTKRLDSCPKTGAPGGAIAYLKVEKPRFLFHEGSTGAVVVAGVTVLLDAFAERAGASTTCAAPSVDRLVASASAPAPDACSSAASAAPRLLVRGGAGSHLSGGQPPVAFFLFSLSRRRGLRGRRGREPLLLAQPVFLVSLFPAFPPPDPSLLLACRPLLLPPLRRVRARGLGVSAGQTAWRSRPPSARKSEMSELQQCIAEE
jgi:hypothetical protein